VPLHQGTGLFGGRLPGEERRSLDRSSSRLDPPHFRPNRHHQARDCSEDGRRRGMARRSARSPRSVEQPLRSNPYPTHRDCWARPEDGCRRGAARRSARSLLDVGEHGSTAARRSIRPSSGRAARGDHRLTKHTAIRRAVPQGGRRRGMARRSARNVVDPREHRSTAARRSIRPFYSRVPPDRPWTGLPSATSRRVRRTGADEEWQGDRRAAWSAHVSTDRPRPDEVSARPPDAPPDEACGLPLCREQSGFRPAADEEGKETRAQPTHGR
jgi:hypothetical protein